MVLGVVALAGSAAVLGGCRGDREDKPPRQFFPDMDDQPKWEPQGRSDFFADGRMMRPPPAGTVPFGRSPVVTDEEWAGGMMDARHDFLKDDAERGPGFYDGLASENRYVERIPAPVTMDMIRHGQKWFNITCASCHGYNGDGKGMVGLQWSYPLPNFHDDKYKKADPNDPNSQLWKDGYLFHVARQGLWNPDGTMRMPGYAHALSERDAWAVVAYIRTLQASREGTLQDVPESVRQQLERTRTRTGQPQGGAQ